MKNSNEFGKEVCEIKLDPNEAQQFYNMSTLFMSSVLINKALEVIKVKLGDDNALSERTHLVYWNLTRLSDYWVCA